MAYVRKFLNSDQLRQLAEFYATSSVQRTARAFKISDAQCRDQLRELGVYRGVEGRGKHIVDAAEARKKKPGRYTHLFK